MLVVQPGLDLLEPGRLEASPGRLRVRVVLVIGPVLEVTAETFFLHDLSRRPRRAGDVARAETRGHEPAARLQNLREPTEEARMVFDPVERDGREDEVSSLRDLEQEKVLALDPQPRLANE